MLIRIAAFFTLLVLVACSSPYVYQESKSFKGRQWHADSAVSLKFEITNASQPYNIFYNVRTGSKFPFCNLYIKYQLTNSADTQKVVEMQQMYVASPVTGRPLGKVLGDLNEEKILAVQNYRFPHPGKYRIDLRQYMRDTLLKEFDALGVLIEPVAAN